MDSEAPKNSNDLVSSHKRKSDTDPFFNFENRYKLRDSDFLWLKGKSNERAIFWCWLYVRYISTLKFSWGNDSATPVYKSLKPASEVNNTEMRSKIIRSFYNEFSEVNSETRSAITARDVYKRMSFIWSTYVNTIRRVHWLKKKKCGRSRLGMGLSVKKT